MITPEQKNKIMELAITFSRGEYMKGMATQRHYDAPNCQEIRQARNRAIDMTQEAQDELQKYLGSLL